MREQTIVLGCRLNVTTYNLLCQISSYTKLRKATLLKAAVSQWLKNAPEELPLDLKVQIARENISHINETIKNIRWTYHQARNATYRIKEMQRQDWLPPHTAQIITNLEETIIKLETELDTWLRNEYIKRGQQP